MGTEDESDPVTHFRVTPTRLAGRVSFFIGCRTLKSHEADRRAFLEPVPRDRFAGHRFDADDPVRIVVLGVDRVLDGIEQPQVLRVISQRELLPDQEVQVLDCPATTRCEAVGLPERVLEVLALDEPLDERRLGLGATLVLTVATPERVHRRLDGVGAHRVDFLVVERAQLLDPNQSLRNSASRKNCHEITSSVNFRPTYRWNWWVG